MTGLSEKIALRASIVLLASEGLPNNAIAKRLGTSRPTVLLWRNRFERFGVTGLLTDATRPGRKKAISPEIVQKVVEATLQTPSDVLEALVGELPRSEEEGDEPMIRRDDGSWLFDGSLDLEDVKSALDVATLEGEKEDAYQTLAGYVIAQMKKIPRTGDTLLTSGFRFEIVDMDGRRVDKILVNGG